MSGAQDSNTSLVYVKLRDEGTVVFRPVEALWLDSTTAQLLTPATYDAEDECWEFEPGSVVHVERRILEGEEACIAISLAE